MSENAKSVFLSYAGADRAAAQRLGRALEAAGVGVVDPAKEIPPGARLMDSLLDAIRTSDGVVFFVPEREGEGKWALAEIGAARALGKPIFSLVTTPYRYANSEVGAVLGGRSVLDASKMPEETLANSIAASLKSDAA
ncbi:MAG: toll/interleukin-1 receptor domain-containing protein [Hyphomicrobiales bacterium]|nr:toll/interleukin-1 receptor domain-containing protein [Hyphomicrobiales bacterium]MCC2108712.1 toll/interleukin-1 receptor domain-containing protein [Hyphomicrobiales bacterium]